MDFDQTSDGSSDQMSDGSGAEAANACIYAGQAYSTGAVVCMSGYEYVCRDDGSWDNSGHRCDSGGGSSDGGADGGQAQDDGQGAFA